MPGCKTPGLFTGRDPLSGTAAPLRHVPPDALPMSALSADEPDGAHAADEPTGQAWSSPFPPSLAFMEEPWRAKPAASLLSLLTPGLAMPAGVSAPVQSRFPAYARRTTPAVSPTQHRIFRAPLLDRDTATRSAEKIFIEHDSEFSARILPY